MHQRHAKKYYVGGMISLICLPILFLVSTIENRKKAINYASIEVEMSVGGTFQYIASSRIESTYVFQGNTEAEKINNFNKFCASIKKQRKITWVVYLPEKCSYNFFVQTIVVVQKNNFMGSVYGNRFNFFYLKPGLIFQQEYGPLSIAEEFQYIYTEMVDRLSFIKSYLVDEPENYSVRIMKYSDLGPPPGWPGEAFFTERMKMKDDPKSKIYFQEFGKWFIPIIISWLLLLFLSIRKSAKIVA